MTTFSERVHWNARTYGQAVRVRASVARTVLIVLCILTPGTNWIIPFAGRIVSGDLVFRF